MKVQWKEKLGQVRIYSNFLEVLGPERWGGFGHGREEMAGGKAKGSQVSLVLVGHKSPMVGVGRWTIPLAFIVEGPEMAHLCLLINRKSRDPSLLEGAEVREDPRD